MKELKEKSMIMLKDYEVGVKPYLSLAEIDQIVKGICASKSYEYSERKMTEDMLILFYGTNLTKEELEEVEYETLNKSGLIDAVRRNIKNIDRVAECLNYMEGLNRSMALLWPHVNSILEKMGSLSDGKATNKK